MKKSLALLIALLLLCAAPLALAEEVTVEIDYEGTYLPFEEYGFQLYLPNDWLLYEPEEGVYFKTSDPTQTQLMQIEVYENIDYTMDSILEELTDTEGYTDVAPFSFNGIGFVIYTNAETNVFGAATLTAAEDYMLFFKFSPADDMEFGELATKIMASLSPIEE